MKQVLQNRKLGKAAVMDVPMPVLQRGRVLVRTATSLISAGTERAAVETVQKGLLTEARERPDLVRTVVNKARTEGLLNTLGKVREKLGTSQTLGYSAAGTVIEVAADVSEFRAGDRVACAGLGFASHAEVLSVPKNLCVRLPDEVDFSAGAFGTVGAIALQGVRLAEPKLGEFVVVIGLGLIGQLTVQLLVANGCRVFGIDLDETRVDLAKKLGADEACISADNPKEKVLAWSRGRGADAILITAATSSSEPVKLAGEISRLKGRVVVVGLTGLEVPRDTFYRRELSLQVSMSYGPGRYDPNYEERGHDYPFAYVRWTENRNIEAFLDLLAKKVIKIEPLVTHRFAIDEAERAFELITAEDVPQLAVLLDYDHERKVERVVQLRPRAAAPEAVRLGVIGVGDYVRSVLLPHFKSAGVEFCSLASATGVTARDIGERFGFARAVSGAEDVLADEDVNLVLVGTRHDTHASLATQALNAGRNVFVEKPLALTDDELAEVIEAARASSAALMVGFNRRFSPLAVAAKEFFAKRSGPLSILYRINAGRISRDHWTQDSQEGGGRIIGEVCHFVDLMQFWIGQPPVSAFAEAVSTDNAQAVNDDSVFITLRFADGSNGCIAYLAEGEKTLGKERIEIFGDGRSVVLDDFRQATFYESGKARETKLRAQDKGQAACVAATCEMVRDGTAAPITLAELVTTTRATFRAVDSLRSGMREDVSGL